MRFTVRNINSRPLRSDKLIISVEGPTASGKTQLGVSLAAEFNTAVVSSDSRQCYKEMCIGTAVPSIEERRDIVHYMIHSHSVNDALTAASFSAEAHKHIETILKKHNKVILVGGSPLYAESILYGLNDLPPIDPEIVNLTRAMSLEVLQQQLKAADPETYERIDQMNRRRLERALQVTLQTGEKFSALLNQPKQAPRYAVVRMRIEQPRTILYERINKRVDAMFQMGLVEEARSLFSHPSEIIQATVGYTELFESFKQRYDLSRAKELIKQHTRNFAKRQLTWYRKRNEMVSLSAEMPFEQALKIIKHLPQGETPHREY